MNIVAQSKSTRALRSRLARIEGQLRGLQKLLDAGADSEVIAQQMAAARKALDKSFFVLVSVMIAEGHADSQEVASLLQRFA